jgi:hypothetical protein
VDEKAGSESLIQKLFMSQLSLSWAVLSNSLNLLFTVGRVWTTVDRDLQLRVLEEVELSTALGPRANTSKETEMAEPETKIITLADADRVEKLLDIIANTVGMPNVPCIRAAAANELAQIEEDLRAQMYPEVVAAEKKAAEERKKAEEENQKRLKEEAEAKKKAEQQPQPASWTSPRDTLAHPVPPPPPQQNTVDRRA